MTKLICALYVASTFQTISQTLNVHKCYFHRTNFIKKVFKCVSCSLTEEFWFHYKYSLMNYFP